MGELFGVKYNDEEEKKPKPPRVNRRTFLRSTAAVGAVAIVGTGGPSMVDATKDTLFKEGLEKSIAKKEDILEQTYGIKVKHSFSVLEKEIQSLKKFIGRDVSGVDEKNSLSKYERALDYIINGLSRYPTPLVRSLGIRSIFIAENLLWGGGKIEGLTYPETSEIFVEISAGILNHTRSFGWDEKKPFNGIFDHELLHMIDQVLLEDTKRIKWLGLDNPGAYSSGKLVENKKGFIDKYAQTNTLEDRASLFSAMVNNSKDVWKRCKTDDVLQKKVLFLQQMMFSNSCGLMNQEYWELIKSGNLRPNFFKKRIEYLLSLDFNKFKEDLKLNNRESFNDDEHGKTEQEIWKLYKKYLSDTRLFYLFF